MARSNNGVSPESQLKNIVQELKKRYPDGYMGKVDDLRSQNSDIITCDLKNLCRKVAGKTALQYLTEVGVIDHEKSLAAFVANLKERYRTNPELAYELFYEDAPAFRYNTITRELHGQFLYDYLAEVGAVDYKKLVDGLIAELKQRSGGKLAYSYGEIWDQNPNINWNRFNDVVWKYLNRSIIHFLEDKDAGLVVESGWKNEDHVSYKVKLESRIDPSDISGKNVLIIGITDELLLLRIRRILKNLRATEKREISPDVNYVIANYQYFSSADNPEMLRYFESPEFAENPPKFILLWDFIYSIEDDLVNKSKAESPNQKLERAKDLFRNSMEKLQSKINSAKGYGKVPFVSEESSAICENATIPSENQSEFNAYLDYVVSFLPQYGNRYMDEKTLRESMSCGLSGTCLSLCGHACGCIFPVAYAVACFVFANPKAKFDLIFDRDKWESRGDYNSGSKVAYRLSAEAPSGDVYLAKSKPWSNM